MTRGRITILSQWPSLWSMAGGGGTTSDSSLVAALLEAGYAVDLVVPAEPSEDDDPLEGPVGLSRVAIGAPRLALPGYFGLWAGWLEMTARYAWGTLRHARRNGRPALVYGFGSGTVPAAALVGRVLGRPSVGKLFGTFLHPALGNVRALLWQFQEVLAFRAPVDLLVVHDDGTQGDKVAAALRVPAGRLRFWRNGVEHAACGRALSQADARAWLGLAEGTPLLVSSSRLAGWKRVDRIIALLPEVVLRHPDAVLAIAGDGPERPALEAQAERLGVAKSVRFLGPLPRERNLELTASADVFCSFYDVSNLGVSLLEALAIGVPIVTMNTGATAELVEDGISGFVLPPEDTAAAAAVVSRLLADADLRRTMAAGARRQGAELQDLHDRARLEVQAVTELITASRHGR